jgi:protease I
VDSFTSKRIGVLAGEAYHELAFWYPVLRFRELGAIITVLGRDAERTYRSRLGYPILPNVSIAAERGTDFDAIILSEGAPPRSTADQDAIRFLVEASRSDTIMGALGMGERAFGSLAFSRAGA